MCIFLDDIEVEYTFRISKIRKESEQNNNKRREGRHLRKIKKIV